MFEQAFRIGASDIHIERFEEGCKIRLRADGKLIASSGADPGGLMP